MDSADPKLRRAALWALGGNLVYLLTQLGVLMALARLSGPEMLGRFGLSLAVATPVVMAANLGLQTALATDAGGRFRFGDYATLRLWSSGLAAAVLLALGPVVMADARGLFMFVAVAAGKIVETYCDLCYGQFQKSGRIDLLARSQALRGSAALAFFILVLWLTRRAELAALAQLGVWSVVALAHDRRMIGRLLPPDARALGRWPEVRTLMAEVWPLGINALAAALSNNAPRIIVGHVLGLVTLGYFTAISYALYAGMFFANALGAAIAPPLSRLWADGQRRAFARLVRRCVAIAALAGLGLLAVGAAAGGPILNLAFGAAYAGYGPALTMVLGALALRFVAVALQTATAAQRRFGALGWLQVAGLAVTIGACWVGARTYGLEGAAAALVVAALVQASLIAGLLVRHSPQAAASGAGASVAARTGPQATAE